MVKLSEEVKKIVNVDAEIVANLQEFVTSVYSICEVLSYIGKVRIKKSIEVTLDKGKSLDDILEYNNKFHIVDRLQLPVNIQGREFLLPVVFYADSVIPFRKVVIYKSGNLANDLKSIVRDVIDTLELLKFNHSDLSKYMKERLNIFRGGKWWVQS